MSIQFSTFKNVIKDFLKLDEEIRSLSKAKIDRMRIRDKLSKEIMMYYKHNNIHSLDLNFDGAKQQLELVESTRHPSVNQKFLRKALVKYCNNDKIVDSMIDHILEEREHNSSISFKLKRIIANKKKPQIDAMNLVKDNKNLIEERFAKLAEYAIIKDGIEPFKPEPKKELKEENLEPKFEKYQPVNDEEVDEEEDEEEINEENDDVNNINNVDDEDEEEIDERNIPIESNYDSDDSDDDYDEDEQDIDIDNIPEEETGYDEKPPDIEKEYPVENTIRNVIANKFDKEPEKIEQKSEKDKIKERGAIPLLKPVSQIDPQTILKELEVKALEAWKKLDQLSSKYIYLGKWLLLQKEKIKLHSTKAQIESNTFIQMNEKIKKYEKELENEQYDNEVIRLKMYIIKYIEVRFSR